MKTKNNSLLKTLFLSLVVMALWGSLFPFIKIGYEAFNINPSSVPDIIMFAGVRFTLCGAIVTLFCLVKKESLPQDRGKSICYVFLSGIFAITLHYAFTYIGLSLTDGSKTALIKQLGILLYVCFAFIFIQSEKFSILKIIGALVGFAGIIVINTSSKGVQFSIGEILIILASVCTVASNIITKLKLEDVSPFWITGFSQLIGGIILLITALVMGADMLTFNIKSLFVFAYICAASVISYTMWYYILKTNSLSKLFIIKFAEPLFACVFSAILLGENIFKLQYLAAFLLISIGIILGNRN